MSRLPLPLCLSLLLCLTAASQDWEQQLIGDRDAANALFESGQLMEGATRLITGMHALPTDQPALVDPAAGNVQFLIFALEYLMTEEQVNTFTTQVLDTENNEFDNFIANLYNLQIGQESFGKTITTQDLQQMTASSNVFVRVGTLFILCEPYYFQDPIFVQQHLDILAAEFPTLGVTQEALLMADLAAQQQQQQQPEPEPETQAKSVDSGPALIAEDPSPAELQQMAASQRTRPDSQFLVRARGALGDLRNDTRRTGALGVLAEVAANDADWRTRYGALNVLEKFHEQGERTRVYATLNAMAQGNRRTPEVARARILLVRKAISDWEAGSTPPGGMVRVLRHVDDLLSMQWEEHTLERVIWEDRIKAVMDLANLLVARGNTRVAIELCERLIAKYPNSQVAERCTQSIEEFRQGRRSVSLE